jgi:glycerol kinase
VGAIGAWRDRSGGVKHVLAIDQGTTGSTCLVVPASGGIAGRGYRAITQHYPQAGWVEHDADEIFRLTLEAAHDALASSGVRPDAIGITNQRETVVVWDRETGVPVGRAIVWQDRRTAGRCRALAPRAGEIGRLTGLVIDPYFSATKLEWLLRDRALRSRAEAGDLCAGTIDTWLVWKLTGGRVHATDPTNASRTLLYDIDAGRWSDALRDTFGVPRALLPEVRRSSGDFGVTIDRDLGDEVPILGVAGDQQAALYGQGCWQVGEGKNTYGTGAFLLLNTGATRPTGGDGLLTTIACDATGGPCYALEASIFIAGAAIQWLRDELRILDTSGESEALARSIPSNDGVYFVPALTGLGAPDWEARARGTIVGLTRGTGRAHLARAALEAMAYATRDVVELMRAHAGTSPGDGIPLRVDGGVSQNDWLMQFQADVLGAVVERPAMVETTALGAAGLAGLAAGVWSSPGEFREAQRITRFEPRHDDSMRSLHAGWRRAVRAALAWARDDAH